MGETARPDAAKALGHASAEEAGTAAPRPKLFVSCQHTELAWEACQQWFEEGCVPSESEIRISACHFNLPALPTGTPSFPAGCRRLNAPCFGGILDEVMKLFMQEDVLACAADMSISIPEYRLDDVVLENMSA